MTLFLCVLHFCTHKLLSVIGLRVFGAEVPRRALHSGDTLTPSYPVCAERGMLCFPTLRMVPPSSCIHTASCVLKSAIWYICIYVLVRLPFKNIHF